MPGAGYAQVDEHGRGGVAIRAHDVARREVTVNDRLLKGRVELLGRIADGRHEACGELDALRRRSSLDDLAQRVTRNALHHDHKRASLDPALDDARELTDPQPLALARGEGHVGPAQARLAVDDLTHVGAQLAASSRAQVDELRELSRGALEHALHAIGIGSGRHGAPQGGRQLVVCLVCLIRGGHGLIIARCPKGSDPFGHPLALARLSDQ